MCTFLTDHKFLFICLIPSNSDTSKKMGIVKRKSVQFLKAIIIPIDKGLLVVFSFTLKPIPVQIQFWKPCQPLHTRRPYPKAYIDTQSPDTIPYVLVSSG